VTTGVPSANERRPATMTSSLPDKPSRISTRTPSSAPVVTSSLRATSLLCAALPLPPGDGRRARVLDRCSQNGYVEEER
jgi:hypothetical protein